jgi:CheY-like chemotaxis protein
MIEQVILNLAVNARDAMPEGGELTFTAHVKTIDEAYATRNAEARPGEFVCMTVADTGCGMSASTKSRIFEPFFTTKAAGKGTGLGLATVYGIVKQHEGWIELESELGRGTIFRIFLPHDAAADAADSPERSPDEGRGGAETILLVEDEPGVRRLAENVLSRHGYRVLTASDGHQALTVWSEHAQQIDLLLTDMVMPEGMSGRELAERLCAASPNLKVIFMSGYSVELAQSDLLLREGVNFLPKPYPASELAAVVRNCLDLDLDQRPAGAR